MKKISLFALLISTVTVINAQPTKLLCKTEDGFEWSNLTIDLTKKIIIDDNKFSKMAFDTQNDAKQKFALENQKVFKPTIYDPIKNAWQFSITKVTDEIVYGVDTSSGAAMVINNGGEPKRIEINRYSLKMHYPPDTRPGWLFTCNKLEKSF